MTVQTTVAKVTVIGNGSTTSFSFSPMRIQQASDLSVTKVSNTGTLTALTQGTGNNNYVVNVTEYPGTGSITYPSSGATRLQSDEKLVITRGTTLTQAVDLENQGEYFAEVQEGVFDKLTLLLQDLNEKSVRSLKVPVHTPSSVNTTLPLPAPNKLLKWNSGGTALENVDDGGGGGGEPQPPPTFSGLLKLEDGSEDNPTYSWNSSQDSGWWFDNATDIVHLSVEGLSVFDARDSDKELNLSKLNDVPALKTKAVVNQDSSVQITGGVSEANIEAIGSASNVDLNISAKGDGKLNFYGLTPFGVDVLANGVTQAVGVDQTPALQTLLDRISGFGGGTVLFPEGSYYFLTTLEIPSNITIKGDGNVNFFVGKVATIRTNGSYSFEEDSARIRSTVNADAVLWPIDTGVTGGEISRFTVGSKWRVRGAGGGAVEVRDRQDLSVVSTDGVDDVTMNVGANTTYLTSWDTGTYPEAAAYFALYGTTDYTLLAKFVQVLLNSSATKGVTQVLSIPTASDSAFTVGQQYFLRDDSIESDVAGSLKNRFNEEVVTIAKKTNVGGGVTELTLTAPVRRTYTTAKGAALFVMNWADNILIDNINFVSHETPNDAPAARQPLVELRYCRNTKGVNLRYNGSGVNDLGRRGNIFRLYSAYNSFFVNSSGRDPKFTDSAEGYIFANYSSTNSGFINCYASGGRHNFIHQTVTSALLSNCISENALISDIDFHGVGESGANVDQVVVYQTPLRSDSSNTSVAALRIGNTAHPGGVYDIFVSGLTVFGNKSTGSRGIDLVPPFNNVNINGVFISGVEDGVYARSNIAASLVGNKAYLTSLTLDNIGRYGIALLGDADAGFTGYQLSNLKFDGITFNGSNEIVSAREVDGLVIRNINGTGVGTGVTNTSFFYDDVLDLVNEGVDVKNSYRGWSLVDCPNARIQSGEFEGLNTASLIVDNGGNTGMKFDISVALGGSALYNQVSESTDSVLTSKDITLGKLLTASDTYTLVKQDINTTIIWNYTNSPGTITVPNTLLRTVAPVPLPTTGVIQEVGRLKVVNISGQNLIFDDDGNVTITSNLLSNTLPSGQLADIVIYRTSATTLACTINSGSASTNWGAIGGTISNQTDLQAALTQKEDFADPVSQAEAEAGTLTSKRTWTPQRVKQAIVALSSSSIPTGNDVIIGRNSAGTLVAYESSDGSVSINDGDITATLTLPAIVGDYDVIDADYTLVANDRSIITSGSSVKTPIRKVLASTSSNPVVITIPYLATVSSPGSSYILYVSPSQSGAVTIELENKLITFTANTTNTDATLTAVSSFTGLEVGQTITGTGIPASTTIASLDEIGGTLEMSQNATATNTSVTVTANDGPQGTLNGGSTPITAVLGDSAGFIILLVVENTNNEPVVVATGSVVGTRHFPSGAVTDTVGSSLSGFNVLRDPITAKTASFSFDNLAYSAQIIPCNHATVAINATINQDGTGGLTYPNGTILALIQTGAAALTFVAGSGATVTAMPNRSLKARGNKSTIGVIKLAANSWQAIGDFEVV